MIDSDSTATQYGLIQEIPLPSIEMIDLMYGDKNAVLGTLFVDSWQDLDSQVKPFVDLDLEFGFNPSRSSLEEETNDWPEGHEKEITIVVGTSQEIVDEFLYHIKNNNHNQIGELLGYPDCCIETFGAHFEHDSTIWTGTEISEYVLKTTPQFTRAPFYTNRFLRYGRPALLYHFPCHPNCRQSIEIGKRRYNLLQELDSEKAEEIKQVLSSAVIYRVTQNTDSNDILDVTDVLYCPEYTVNSDTRSLSVGGKWNVGRPRIDENFRDTVQNTSEINLEEDNLRESLSKLTDDENEGIRVVLFY